MRPSNDPRRGYDVVPVHPTLKQAEGRTCFARVQDVSPPVEAALLMTPPAVTEQVVRDCAEAGVKSLVVISAGFAEAGDAGRDLQRALADRLECVLQRLHDERQ